MRAEGACVQSIYVCAYFGATKPVGKKRKKKLGVCVCADAVSFFFFFFFAGSSKSDSPDGAPLATMPPLVTRRPNTARARVSVGWNAKVSHSLDAHTSEMCTHVHTHTHTHGAPGQNSTDVLAVAACESARAGVFDGDGDGEGLVRGSGGGWVWGARREAGAPSRRASSEILMPRSASDLPSDSRSDMSTQIRRRLGEKKTKKKTQKPQKQDRKTCFLTNFRAAFSPESYRSCDTDRQLRCRRTRCSHSD